MDIMGTGQVTTLEDRTVLGMVTTLTVKDLAMDRIHSTTHTGERQAILKIHTGAATKATTVAITVKAITAAITAMDMDTTTVTLDGVDMDPSMQELEEQPLQQQLATPQLTQPTKLSKETLTTILTIMDIMEDMVAMATERKALTATKDGDARNQKILNGGSILRETTATKA
jgi:hypothetical protein